jgi:hypothetical protein
MSPNMYDKEEIASKSFYSKLFTQKWTEDKVQKWAAAQPWLCGCNYIPYNAINQLEMFQADTFDPKRIDLELTWAEKLGFNCIRVFLHYLLWESDVTGFKKRVTQFLEVCEKHKIKVLFVLFDDCWTQEPQIGLQPNPLPSVHNSGWAASPGRKRVLDTKYWPKLEQYVVEILSTFKTDNRILGWDLYNEPGNSRLGLETFPLLVNTFYWARTVSPSQPLTVGIWHWLGYFSKWMKTWGNIFILSSQASDIITFHNYGPQKILISQIKGLQKLHRPLICTEYMARPFSSRFETHLPIFKQYNVGAINWGFVSGKTNTIFQWGTKQGSPEPSLWFHDIFRSDGTPYREEEIQAIKKATFTQ